MKKQLVSILLALLLTASLMACTNSAEPSQQAIAYQNEHSPKQLGQTQEGQPPEEREQRPEGQAPGGPGQPQAGGGQPFGQQPGQMPGHYEPVELDVSSDMIDAIMRTYSGKSFKEGSIPDDLLEAILYSGQKAPSATNAQPWHFTVIKNSDIAAQLASRNYQQGAVVIVVSGKPDDRRGVNVAFDCALATQNMYLAAQSLGLGAHLYYSGVQNINDSMKDSLGIPDEYEAQIIMLVGYIADDVDAMTSASARNPIANNVNYVD